MKKQRATNEEDKLEKRQVILNAAMQIFKNTSYNEVTMSAVAVKAKLAKGTLFLYFPTKEEMFLALMEEQLIEWFNAVDMELDLQREIIHFHSRISGCRFTARADRIYPSAGHPLDHP
ncbi:MAG: helix-turn-helix transcriptional regulator [Anaerolineales bacterium]|nr:helix-turn-helix transcriptional regulator [Anaerolineales bacterium]